MSNIHAEQIDETAALAEMEAYDAMVRDAILAPAEDDEDQDLPWNPAWD